MALFAAILLIGAALSFVFKASRTAREEGHATIATMLTLSSIGFAVTLLIVIFPALALISSN